MKNLIKIISMLLLSISFSCSKPENGTNGTNGIDGVNGTTGPIGTANVMYSNWISPSFLSANNSLEVAEIIEPKINQSILDTGTILVYVRLGNEVYQLNYYNLALSYSIVYVLSQGKIKIVRNILPSNGGQFRYVIIPGGISTARTSAKLDFKKMTYNQVCASLKIPE